MTGSGGAPPDDRDRRARAEAVLHSDEPSYPLIVNTIPALIATMTPEGEVERDGNARNDIDTIAQGIQRKQAEQAVRRSETFLAEAQALSQPAAGDGTLRPAICSARAKSPGSSASNQMSTRRSRWLKNAPASFERKARGKTVMTTAPGVLSQPASTADASRAGESRTSTCEDGLSAFLSVRPRLFGIAYRMLGSAAEAEDIVQDVWVRWQTADRSVVRDAPAFLAMTTTRLAINVMQSARSRRETYVGPGLPEPVDTSADPGLGAERGEGLEAGILLLLEKLSPTERAAYILREAFDYRYRDIANVLRLAEANARQVVTRARQHVANGRRMSASSTEQRRLLDAFIAAAKDGDVADLEGLFASVVAA